jgi:hypothetical protein
VVNTPGAIQPPFVVLEQALVEHISADLGGFVRAVFSMHDPDALAALLRDAGLRDVTASVSPVRLRLPAPAEFLWQYINLTPMGPLVAQATEATSPSRHLGELERVGVLVEPADLAVPDRPDVADLRVELVAGHGGGLVAALDDHGVAGVVEALGDDPEVPELLGDATEDVAEDVGRPVVAARLVPEGVLRLVPRDVMVHGGDDRVDVTPRERSIRVLDQRDVLGVGVRHAKSIRLVGDIPHRQEQPSLVSRRHQI